MGQQHSSRSAARTQRRAAAAAAAPGPPSPSFDVGGGGSGRLAGPPPAPASCNHALRATPALGVRADNRAPAGDAQGERRRGGLSGGVARPRRGTQTVIRAPALRSKPAPALSAHPAAVGWRGSWAAHASCPPAAPRDGDPATAPGGCKRHGGMLQPRCCCHAATASCHHTHVPAAPFGPNACLSSCPSCAHVCHIQRSRGKEYKREEVTGAQSNSGGEAGGGMHGTCCCAAVYRSRATQYQGGMGE